MKTNKRFQTTLQAAAGLAAILLTLTGTPVLYAEETAGGTAVQNTPPASLPALSKKERFEKFLENHPKLKEKLDVNNDGTVDKQEFKQAREDRAERRKEKREEFLENHPKLEEKMDRNNDGKVDRKEWKEAKEYRREHGYKGYGRDRDNNPPGRAGGPGTNWENRPGPQGGPGASPNRRGGFFGGGRHGGRK